MSMYDYDASRVIAARDDPFAALIMAAMRKADADNLVKLQKMWPDLWTELDERYKAPGGKLDEERTEAQVIEVRRVRTLMGVPDDGPNRAA